MDKDRQTMKNEKLHAIAQLAAKSIKTENDLNDLPSNADQDHG